MNTDDRALADQLSRLRDTPTNELTQEDLVWWLRQPGQNVPTRVRVLAADRLEAFHVKPVVGERYSASGDHVVDVDDHNTFQVVPVNRVDGDSLAISVAEAMNAAISTPVAAQGDEVREQVCDNCGTEWFSTDGKCHLCRRGLPTLAGAPHEG